MKTYFYALGTFIALTLTNCQTSKYNSEYIIFSEPQPAGDNNIAAIPKELWNNYFNRSDSSSLLIDANGLYRKEQQFTTISRTKPDSTIRIIGDSVVIDREGRSYPARKIKDSLLLDISRIDTLFKIGEGYALRKHGKDYIFNKRSENGWMIYKLSLNRNGITIGNTSDPDLKLLKEIGKSLSDTIPYRFQLDKKQFKAFLKQGGFSDIDTLQLVK